MLKIASTIIRLSTISGRSLSCSWTQKPFKTYGKKLTTGLQSLTILNSVEETDSLKLLLFCALKWCLKSSFLNRVYHKKHRNTLYLSPPPQLQQQLSLSFAEWFHQIKLFNTFFIKVLNKNLILNSISKYVLLYGRRQFQLWIMWPCK